MHHPNDFGQFLKKRVEYSRSINGHLISWICIHNKSMKCVLLWLQCNADITYCFFQSLEVCYNEVLLYVRYLASLDISLVQCTSIIHASKLATMYINI